MTISNRFRWKYNNEMYEISNGEKDELIYVTGSHLVYDQLLKYVYVSN